MLRQLTSQNYYKLQLLLVRVFKLCEIMNKMPFLVYFGVFKFTLSNILLCIKAHKKQNVLTWQVSTKFGGVVHIPYRQTWVGTYDFFPIRFDINTWQKHSKNEKHAKQDDVFIIIKYLLLNIWHGLKAKAYQCGLKAALQFVTPRYDKL